MIDPNHKLSVTRQAKVLGMSRSTAYYRPKGPAETDIARMALIDRLHLEYSFAGARMPRYLLRTISIDRPNQVWAMDITYLPIRREFLYLVAVMNCYRRKILAWKLSKMMHAEFCVSTLQEAISQYGIPETMNTDQGSQFTSLEFISVLKAHGIAISMDGNGCWRDTVFIERYWRTVKYEGVYLRVYECTSEARANLTRYLTFSVPGPSRHWTVRPRIRFTLYPSTRQPWLLKPQVSLH